MYLTRNQAGVYSASGFESPLRHFQISCCRTATYTQQGTSAEDTQRDNVGTLVRLPTYLVRRSGGFSFRIIVPLRLRNTLRRKVIKHALHTTDPRLAQVKALYLAVRYQQAFVQIDGVV